MKKQLLPLFALFVGGALHAGAVDDLIAFNNLKTKNCIDWMNFKQKTQNTEIDLVKKHEQEWSKFMNDQMSKSAKATDHSPEAMEVRLREKLSAAIALYKTQAKEWADECKSKAANAESLFTKQKDAFEKFQDGLPAESLPKEKKGWF